jgi:hypothetical protein
MIGVLVSIYDVKAETYTAPRSETTVELARRNFGDAVNDARDGNALALHPEDYILFRVGSFNYDTGEIIQEEKISIANGIDVLMQK